MFREEEALEICEEIIREKGFDINVLGAKQEDETFVFLFSESEEKNQIKKLTSELRRILNTNVKLRKIETRERAEQLGGLGKCGRVLCCASWLGKNNPSKFENIKECANLSTGKNNLGACGRPMCCLFYLKETWLEEKEKQAEEKKQKENKQKEEKSGDSKKSKEKDKKKKPKRRVRKLKI